VNARVRGAIWGALLGAGIGAAYGWFFVGYRDRLGKGPLLAKRPCGCDEEKEAEDAREVDTPVEAGESDVPEELRRPSAYRLVVERARELREQDPELRWQEAMKRARNHAAIEQGVVPE
jgi:hypothetical protein